MGIVVSKQPVLVERLWDTTVCNERIRAQLQRTANTPQACKKALKAVRGLIIQQIDFTFIVTGIEDPLLYRKKLNWREYKTKEEEAAKQLYEKRSNISNEVISDVLHIFRDMKDCFSLELQTLTRQFHLMRTSYFSNVCINECGIDRNVKRLRIIIGSEISNIVERFKGAERVGSSFKNEIRGLRNKLLKILNSSTEDLRRYEQELDYVLHCQPRFGGQTADTILYQYIAQLQQCVFCVESTQKSRQSRAVFRESLSIFPVTLDQFASDDELSDGGSITMDTRFEIEEKKENSKKQLIDDFMKIYEKCEEEKSTNALNSTEHGLKISTLMEVYKANIQKYCVDVSTAEHLPDYHSGNLDIIFKQELEKQKAIQRRRDADAYIMDVRKALEAKFIDREELSDQEKLDRFLERQRNIMMQMERGRWDELDIIQDYEEQALQKQEESYSDFIDVERETLNVTAAQVAIFHIAENAAQGSNMKVAQVVKDQIESCKNHEKNLRDMKAAQVVIKREKLNENIKDEQDFNVDDEKSRAIEEKIEEKYSDIERIALDMDSDDDDEFSSSDDKKKKLLSDMEKCVEDLQKLTRELNDLKDNAVLNIDAKLSEIQATQLDLREDFKVMLGKRNDIESEIRQRNTEDISILKDYMEQMLQLVKEFDIKRENKLQEKLTTEQNWPEITDLLRRQKGEIKRYLEKQTEKITREMRESKNESGKPGDATLTLDTARKLKDFVTNMGTISEGT